MSAPLASSTFRLAPGSSPAQLWQAFVGSADWEFWGRWLHGLLRVAPAMVLLPLLGARYLPPAIRWGLAAALAFGAMPYGEVEPGWRGWGGDLLQGTLVAVEVAAALWAAAMAGGLWDQLRGGREELLWPEEASGGGPGSLLLGTLAAYLFLAGGGPARMAAALQGPAELGQGAWLMASEQLVMSITLAVSLALPVVVATLLFEVASALLHRAASPAQLQPVLAPVRSVLLLALLGWSLERLVSGWMAAAFPP